MISFSSIIFTLYVVSLVEFRNAEDAIKGLSKKSKYDFDGFPIQQFVTFISEDKLGSLVSSVREGMHFLDGSINRA